MAALELHVQSEKKEGGSVEIRCLIAAEAEKTRVLEQLIENEAEKSWKWEEKMKEMTALMARSSKACAADSPAPERA